MDGISRNPKPTGYSPWALVAVACLLFPGMLRAQAPAPDFETQVLPVLTRAGCNSGACHGAAIGRGGFRLSLLGYDPDSDYDNLLHEFSGRRVHLAQPEKSLVLRKPSGRLLHEGGIKLPASGDGYKIVLDWIKAGAPREPRRQLERLEIAPTRQLVANVDEKFSLTVTAHFSDGSSDDVTRWALLTPADPAALRVSAAGEVTALRRGQHPLMVRFLGEVGSVTATVPLHDSPTWKGDLPRANFVDDHVNRTLAELRLPPSPRADDAAFVRRVHIDLIGTLPDPEEVDAFLVDPAPERRAKLVERLLQRPEFIDFWSYKWGDLLRITSTRLQPEGAAALHGWIRQQVKQNTPLDRIAREMLLATGDAFKDGPANFSRIPNNALTHAEHVSQVFLGVRLQCANCHNHPFDRWTQNDYHGLAAVFARVGRGRIVGMLPRGEVTHPRTGKAMSPRLPGGSVMPADEDPRDGLARWLTAPDNPFFARAAVNRIWRELMGRGLVEPVDDHRTTNPPTHPVLLDALARDFVKHGFDVRHAIRTIVASEAYQRSSRSLPANGIDDRFYSRALVKPLPPPVLVDAVTRVTGVAEKLGNQPPGTRAIALGDSKVPSLPLDLLGRCSRDDACTPELASGSLALALHTINGPWLNAKIAHPNGRLHQLIAAGRSDSEIVSEFYRVALGRQPTQQEREHWQRRLGGLQGQERTAALEDFLWALLNATEFVGNH